jgi:hypothetical protein
MQNTVAFVIIGILVLIIIGLSTNYFQPTKTTTTSTTTIIPIKICEDSDGGKNYYVKGSLDVGCPEGATCGFFTDQCKDANTLVENFCINKEPSVELYNCPYGCENGACLSVLPTT